MYIRLVFGRDRGHVKDFPFVEAREMLALGQALPVDLEEPNPLGFREIEAEPAPVPELSSTVSFQPSAQALPTPAPVHLVHREGKKKR